MKHLIIVLFFLLLTENAFSAPGELRIIEGLSMFSKILGQEVKFSVCLPVDYYSENRSYPVTYLLHGLGDDESSWLEYGCISQLYDRMHTEGEIIPMIFIMPQGFRCYYSNDYQGRFMYQDMFFSELIPYIDHMYRTIPDKQHRAALGYSMGGFGALILPLKHPEEIETCVALSISVRTDSQYMEEYAPEWDQQWGSIFGGEGKTGVDRITEYYKQNSPFHILTDYTFSGISELKIYIVNGDDEQTLCRSNEELHILMKDKGINHEYRVENGGHEFNFWRRALPNSLRFISDAFEGKDYRGDKPVSFCETGDDVILKKIQLNGKVFAVSLPEEYEVTSRKYPVLYMVGSIDNHLKKQSASILKSMTLTGTLPPMILVFVEGTGEILKPDFFASMEKKLRIREGYRFRSVLGFEDGGDDALGCWASQEVISSCVLIDAFPDQEKLDLLLSKPETGVLKNTWFYITAPDKGRAFHQNGNLHMGFHDRDIYHEYRVREGTGGPEWYMKELPEALIFIAKKFHN